MITLLVTRRRLAVASVLVVVAGVGYALWGSNDERQILSLLSELARELESPAAADADARRSRASQALQRAAVPELRLFTPELGEIDGVDAVAELFAGLAGVRVTLSIQQGRVQTSAGRAMATLVGTLVTDFAGEERRDTRTVRVELVRQRSGFRVVSVRAEPRDRAQPEARP